MKKVFTILITTLLVASGVWLYFGQTDSAEEQVKVEERVAEQKEVPNEEVDTSDWLTYRNEELGLELKYPNDWEVINLSDERAGIALRSPHYSSIRSGSVDFSGDIYVKSISNPYNLSAEELFKTFSDTSRFWFDKHEHKNININGLSGIKFIKFKEDSTSFYRTEIYLSCDKNLILFSYIYEEDKYQDVLNNVVSSLKCSFM